MSCPHKRPSDLNVYLPTAELPCALDPKRLCLTSFLLPYSGRRATTSWPGKAKERGGSRADRLGAQYGQWKDAIPDLARAIELNPNDDLSWYLMAPLLLENGDVAGYHKRCQAMLARFAATEDLPAAQRMAKGSLLLSLAGVDLATAVSLAEKKPPRPARGGGVPKTTGAGCARRPLFDGSRPCNRGRLGR